MSIAVIEPSKINVFISGWWWRLCSNWSTVFWSSFESFPQYKDTRSVSNPIFCFRPSVSCSTNSGEQIAMLSIFRYWFFTNNKNNSIHSYLLQLRRKYRSSLKYLSVFEITNWRRNKLIKHALFLIILNACSICSGSTSGGVKWNDNDLSCLSWHKHAAASQMNLNASSACSIGYKGMGPISRWIISIDWESLV